MIRKLRETDLPAVMRIWLDTNIEAHDFIAKTYWESNYDMVKGLLPDAEVFVYEADPKGEILGFIGLVDDYVAGLFVKKTAQSQGIGKALLDHGKTLRNCLRLSVYQKNSRALRFYRREQFAIQKEATDDRTGQTELVLAWKKQGRQD